MLSYIVTFCYMLFILSNSTNSKEPLLKCFIMILRLTTVDEIIQCGDIDYIHYLVSIASSIKVHYTYCSYTLKQWSKPTNLLYNNRMEQKTMELLWTVALVQCSE